MFKLFLELLVLLALVNLAYQYWPRSGGELIPVMNAEGKYGFVDGGGRVRIEFEWDNVSRFDEGGLERLRKMIPLG